jgi:alginate O-acetyltransferase complex protein AlgI
MILERANIIRLEGKLWPLGLLYTLLIVIFGWVLFRSQNISQGFSYLCAMFGVTDNNTAKITIDMLINNRLLIMLVLGIIGCFPVIPILMRLIATLKMKLKINQGYFLNASVSLLQVFVLFGILVLSGMALGGNTYIPFIYAQF